MLLSHKIEFTEHIGYRRSCKR